MFIFSFVPSLPESEAKFGKCDKMLAKLFHLFSLNTELNPLLQCSLETFLWFFITMDAQQEACLTLDILAAPCKQQQQQQLQHLHVAPPENREHSNAPPTLPSIQDTENEDINRCSVTTTKIFRDGGKKDTNKGDTKFIPLTEVFRRSSAFSIKARRQDVSAEDKN